MIYLDNAATTPVSKDVLEAMLPWLTENYGNAGSLHSMGRKAARAIEKARQQVAKPINANPDNIIFTSGGSEANTLAICGLADHLLKEGKTHIITSAVEHASVHNAIKSLFYKGFTTTYIPVYDDGTLNMVELERSFTDKTGLVSIMGTNNETGVEFPIRRIGELCKGKGVLFHTDCVQAYGNREDIDVEKCHIDFLSVSAHKFHGPKGAGFLYAKDITLLSPIVYGGSQERGLRAGTENIPAIVGLGVAAENYYAEIQERRRYFSKLKLVFISNLIQGLGGIQTAFALNGRVFYGGKTINLRFNNIDGETLLLLLDKRGISVSAGSACHAHSAEPSHVLKAMKLTDKEARSSIRVSFSEENTIDEAIDAANIIAESVKLLRGEM